MVSSRIPSIIERRPRAPVLRSTALRAIAPSASSASEPIEGAAAYEQDVGGVALQEFLQVDTTDILFVCGGTFNGLTGGGGAGRYRPQGRRPQDRRARPALDYGRYPARHHVRPAEPRRRRGGRDLERGRRGHRAAALHLRRP